MRLFLALIPSEDSLDLLEKWQSRFRAESPLGRPVNRDHLHLTLAFDGRATPESLQKYLREGERLHRTMTGKEAIAAPSLAFDTRSVPGLGLVTFAPDFPLWKSLDESPVFPGGDAFWPHITLFRKFFLKEPSVRPIEESSPFSFSRLSLIESRLFSEGSRYFAKHNWPFPRSPLATQKPSGAFPERDEAGSPPGTTGSEMTEDRDIGPDRPADAGGNP